MSSQGKAYTVEQREFMVRLKQSFDEERATQPSVSTRNPAARVAKGLKVSLWAVKTVLAEYTRAGHVSAPVTTLRIPCNSSEPRASARADLRQEGTFQSLRTAAQTEVCGSIDGKPVSLSSKIRPGPRYERV